MTVQAICRRCEGGGAEGDRGLGSAVGMSVRQSILMLVVYKYNVAVAVRLRNALRQRGTTQCYLKPIFAIWNFAMSFSILISPPAGLLDRVTVLQSTVGGNFCESYGRSDHERTM